MSKNNKEKVVKWDIEILDVKINGVSVEKPIPSLVPQEVAVNGGNSIIYSWDYSSQDRQNKKFIYNMYHSGSLSLYDRLFNK